MANILKIIFFIFILFLSFFLSISSRNDDIEIAKNEILEEVSKNTDTLYIHFNKQVDYYSDVQLIELKAFVKYSLNANTIYFQDINKYKLDYIKNNPTQFYCQINNYFIFKRCNFDILQGDGSISYTKSYIWFFRWFEISKKVTGIS